MVLAWRRAGSGQGQPPTGVGIPAPGAPWRLDLRVDLSAAGRGGGAPQLSSTICCYSTENFGREDPGWVGCSPSFPQPGNMWCGQPGRAPGPEATRLLFAMMRERKVASPGSAGQGPALVPWQLPGNGAACWWAATNSRLRGRGAHMTQPLELSHCNWGDLAGTRGLPEPVTLGLSLSLRLHLHRLVSWREAATCTGVGPPEDRPHSQGPGSHLTVFPGWLFPSYTSCFCAGE